jgi:hypothetical protein
LKQIEDFDIFIYNLENSPDDISEAISKWKAKGGRMKPIEIDDYLPEGHDWNAMDISSTEIQTLSPFRLSSKQDTCLTEGKTKTIFYSHNLQVCFIFANNKFYYYIFLYLLLLVSNGFHHTWVL